MLHKHNPSYGFVC